LLGVSTDDLKPPRIAPANLFEGGKRALVALHRNDMARAQRQQGAGQPARTGTDLDHRRIFKRTRGACDPCG